MSDFAEKLAQTIAQNRPQFQAVHNQPQRIPEAKVEDQGTTALGLAAGGAAGKWAGMELMDRYGAPARNQRADVLHTTASLLDESTWEASRHNPNTQALLQDMHGRGDSRVQQDNDGTFTFAYYLPKTEAQLRAQELGKEFQSIQQGPAPQKVPQEKAAMSAPDKDLPAPTVATKPPSIDPRKGLLLGLHPTGEQVKSGLYGEPARVQAVATGREERKEEIAYTEAQTKRTEKDMERLEEETIRIRKGNQTYEADRELDMAFKKQQIQHMKNQDELARKRLENDQNQLKLAGKDIRIKEMYGRVDNIMKTREKQEKDLQNDYTKAADPVAYAERSSAQTRALLNEITSVASQSPHIVQQKGPDGKIVETPVSDPYIQKAGTYWAVRGIDVISDAVLRKNTPPEKKAQLFLEAKNFWKYAKSNGVEDPIMDKKVWLLYFNTYPEETKNPANKEILNQFTPEELSLGVKKSWLSTLFSGQTSSGSAYQGEFQ